MRYKGKSRDKSVYIFRCRCGVSRCHGEGTRERERYGEIERERGGEREILCCLFSFKCDITGNLDECIGVGLHAGCL